MSEVLVAPDVEALLVSALPDLLAAHDAAATVATRIPNPRPDRLVRVRRRGGPRHDVVLETARVAVECWAPTEGDAADLAALAAGLIVSLKGETVDSSHITGAEILGGPSNDPDPDTDTPRYTLTVQLTTFAEPV